MPRLLRGGALLLLSLLSAEVRAQIDPATLRPAGYHPNIVSYYTAPYFANALYHGGEWLEYTGNEFGTAVDVRSPQFENGYPRSLQPGRKLRALVYGLNADYYARPASWPSRTALARGRILVTWRGAADIRLTGGRFSADGSSGGATGVLTDGRRVYLCTSPDESTQTIEVHEVSAPVTEIRVWLAPPDDPATTINENETGSLEGQLFHPVLLQRIADANWAFLRVMDWGATNASPQQDWSDRRVPGHAFMSGILNPRAPAPATDGNRETGVAWEHMVALSNATGRDLWINVPHLATDDYVTRLARLIRFGSDGVNPYPSPQASPVHPPLRSDLRVWVEYSNEIWSNGYSFPQGDWAEDQATRSGLSKPQFNARRFCDTWRIFQQVFEGRTRLVRVAAIFTALDSYSRPFLQEIGTYGAGLSPAVRPDVLAVTTYFGNDIQGYVAERGFTNGKLFTDAYWSSSTFRSHLTTTFDEWTRRMLAGDAAAGRGPDATNIGGGFPSSLRTLPAETLGYALPIVAYEGGPSLFTDDVDGGAANGDGVPTDDGVTTFMEAMNRDPRMADVYRIHLELAKSKGLWTHTPYTDTSSWGKFGQWGHLETLDAAPSGSPKYALVLEHFQQYTTLRHVDAPAGNVPRFTTDAILPVGIAGQSYSADIATDGGDGARTVAIAGAFLERGLSVSSPAAGVLRVSGRPTTSRKNYLLLRVHDADGDPAWRTFTLETFGGPGTLVQSDFRGTSPSQSLPWTKTFVRDPRVTWSGWSLGAGASPAAAENALGFAVSAPESGNETLAQAFADSEYLRATITPSGGAIDLRGAEIRFATRRIGYHSPLGYALSTSVSGFSAPAALYVSSEVDKGNMDEIEHTVTLPASAAFASISGPLEVRIYAFGAQYEGHATSLTAFKLTTPTTEAGGGKRRTVRH
jgi:hypothetical protein